MNWLFTTAFNILIRRTVEMTRDGALAETLRSNLTLTLDNLLKDYDRKFRPSGRTTRVYINVNVRSMGPISEQDMSYSMDCYFRQTWRDDRLKFVGKEKTLSLGISMLDKIWKPDTYFWNGAKSYLHKLTTPNKFVRLSQDGSVYFSSRLTIKAKCPMYLQRFPLDVQICPLIIGSFAYREKEIEFEWTEQSAMPVSAAKGMSMSQFELKTIEVHNTSVLTRDAFVSLGPESYSTLRVNFILERHMGYFLINFYAPCTLIVILSWVAFWLNREATADRIALGATSILTMTFIALDSRQDLPRVTYPTALDVYILICYGFLLTCIIEFAMVHVKTKFNTGDPEMRMFEVERIRALGMGPDLASIVLRRRKSVSCHAVTRPLSHAARLRAAAMGDGSGGDGGQETGGLVPSLSWDEVAGGGVNPVVECFSNAYSDWADRGRKIDPFDTEVNSVSQIDRVSRVLFPACFALISCAYWLTYIRKDVRF